MDEWTVFEEKLSKLPLTNKDARKVVRFFASGATLCEVDKQGRVLIPENLREFAGMQKDVVVEGSMKRVELWAREKYVDATSADEIDESMEALDGLDIDL
jgi:MraZ protein